MATMTHNIKEESDNTGKHHDDDGTIDDDKEENGLGDDEDFDGFDKNEDVTSETDEVYICALNNRTGSGMFPSYAWGRTGIRNLKKMTRTKRSP